MHQLYLTFKTSMKEGRRAQALVGVALFTALDVILSSYASIRIIPNVLTISFARAWQSPPAVSFSDHGSTCWPGSSPTISLISFTRTGRGSRAG